MNHKAFDNTSNHHDHTLLSSKICIPNTRDRIIERTHVFRKLDEASSKKLIMVKAPVGYGKTTAVAKWAEKNKNKHLIAWITLDKSDDDRIKFWHYFVYAIDQILDVDLMGTISAVHASMLKPSEMVLNVVLNILSKIESEVFVILDDFHLIKDPEINREIEYFIEFMPSNIHLIIITRGAVLFPTSKLKLTGKLLEMNMKDLQFSCEETTQFFQSQEDLKLSAGAIQELGERTEGWIAAIKVALLTLKEVAGEEEHIKKFDGDNYHLLTFITEEIIDKQPMEIQSFLYKTAILETLSGPVCNAVAEIENAQEILEYLYNNQLFVDHIDKSMMNYKYHKIFLAFLRNRLRNKFAVQEKTLHCKASCWYEANDNIEKAIVHSLYAQNHENTIRLVSQRSKEWIDQGQYKKVIALLDKLPQQVLNISPQICIYYALSKALVWQLYREDAVLLSKGIDLETDVYREYKFELEIIKAAIALNVEDIRVEEVVRHLNAALSLKMPISSLHGEVYSKLGYVCLVNGDFINGDKYYTKALRIARKFNLVNILLNALHSLGHIKFNNGFTTNALEFVNNAIAMVEDSPAGTYPTANTVYLSAAYAYYELNNLTLANKYIEKGIELSKAIQDDYGLLMGYVFKSMVLTAEKRFKEAIDMIDLVDKYCSKPEYRFVMTQVISHIVTVLVRVGKRDTAEELVYKYRITMHHSTKFIYEEENISLGKLNIVVGKSERILPTVDKMLSEAQNARRTWSILKLLLLKAVANHQIGNVEAAMSSIKEALQIACEKGYLRTFIDGGEYVRALLSDFMKHESGKPDKDNEIIGYALKLLSYFTDDSNQESAGNGFVNQLKPRELEVLQYIYSGYSNQEIADKLFVSVSSVKKYINNIYEKMSVKNRAQAIAAIRQFDIKL